MSVIAYESQEAEVTTSGPAWADVASITHDFGQEAEYFLSGQCRFWGSVADKGLSVRVIIDGDPKAGPITVLPRDSLERFGFFPMGRFVFTVGEHILKLQMASEDGTQTISVDQARLRVDKR